MAKKEAKTNKKENNKNKRSFFKDFKAELKKVVWPTPKQLFNNTVAVITIVLITAAIVCVLDIVFEQLNRQGIDRVKQVIETINSTDENTTSEENTTSNENTSTEQSSDETTNTDTSTQEGETTQDAENNTQNVE